MSAYRPSHRGQAPDTCPSCHGDGGWVAWTFSGYFTLYGPEPNESWELCETCQGSGTVPRVERLAWLIGESRERGPAYVGVM